MFDDLRANRKVHDAIPEWDILDVTLQEVSVRNSFLCLVQIPSVNVDANHEGGSNESSNEPGSATEVKSDP